MIFNLRCGELLHSLFHCVLHCWGVYDGVISSLNDKERTANFFTAVDVGFLIPLDRSVVLPSRIKIIWANNLIYHSAASFQRCKGFQAPHILRSEDIIGLEGAVIRFQSRDEKQKQERDDWFL